MKVECAFDEMVDIDLLVPNPKNPNQHSDRQIKLLAKIMAHQGWRSPIVVSNQSGFIIKGHGRLMAAKLNGWTHAPVDKQDYASEADAYADMVADNKIAELSETDLSMVLNDVLDLGPDFDFDLLGIPDFKLPEDFEPQADEDEVPGMPVEPITKRGDIWQLGRHRLMCGDSTAITDVERLMNGEKAEMVFTDPPYNVAFNGRSGKFEVIKNDDLEADKFKDFIREVAATIHYLSPHQKYIWCNWKFYGVLQELFEFKACIVWAKNVFGLGRGYRHQHEFCLFYGKIDEEIKNESDLWEVAKDREYTHPTQKPVALAERALGNHKEVLTVVDLFGGSGSTLIACEKTERKCFMMELDPIYCDVIVKRWENYTGQKAALVNPDAEVA